MRPGPICSNEEYIISKATPIALLWVALHKTTTPTCCYQPTDSYLITAWAPGPHALAVVAATPGCTIFPEVDEVHQWLWALDTQKARGVPLLVVSSPVSIDHRAVSRGGSLAELTDLEGIRERGCGHVIWVWKSQFHPLCFLCDAGQDKRPFYSLVWPSVKWDKCIVYLVRTKYSTFLIPEILNFLSLMTVYVLTVIRISKTFSLLWKTGRNENYTCLNYCSSHNCRHKLIWCVSRCVLCLKTTVISKVNKQKLVRRTIKNILFQTIQFENLLNNSLRPAGVS